MYICVYIYIYIHIYYIYTHIQRNDRTLKLLNIEIMKLKMAQTQEMLKP